ncbi:sulfurtransferase [Arthrobacter sp. FW306-07-I]|uniref:sulfurtransferase n=1 Tax=Arthrobacter sp. FW306-07-I TaxID=2879622 RepID=UPI001F3E60E6|nr:sulfurtransferase [Arthrobacter sp. FW306-07-I]UKA74072.1 sulfurtransferase [Arthrobacter sp. FW306-07-I]
MKPLIDVPELEARLAAGYRTVLLDVRWALGDPHGHEHYLAEHLPGAVFVDLATELSDSSVPDRGRHPLPAREQFQESAQRWGIRNGDVVVAYDDSANMAAARLWWMLRDAGLAAVYLLDGGLAAWRAAGLPLESGPVQPSPGNVELGSGHMPALDAGAAAGWAHSGLLLDARAGERYRGEVEPVDPRAGHIPGAVSAPTAGNVDNAGRFLPPGQLRRRFADLGVQDGTPVAVYCGSGVTAAHEVAALEVAGFRAALYPGSFSEWSNRPELPVAIGAEPGGVGSDTGGTGAPAGKSAGAGGSVAL